MGKFDKTKPQLGRGLSSLLSVSDIDDGASQLPVMRSIPSPEEENSRPEEAAVSGATDKIQQLSLDAIIANPHQPRKHFDETSLSELAASLKSTGVIQPILVRSAGNEYQLIAGERRWRAARIAGLSTIPAIVRQVDSAEQAQIALIENIQRADLNAIDRAQSYRALMDQLGLTQAELATRLGEERSGIANYLRLLNLVAPVRELVRSGELSVGHAKLLAGIEDMLEQQRLADLSVTGQLSVRQLEKLLQNGQSNKPTTPAGATGASPHIRDLEQSLSRQLGMRVQLRIRGKKGAGRLSIQYNSLDQFDELLGRLAVKADNV